MVVGALLAVFTPTTGGLILTYILLIASALAALAFPVIYAVRHPQTAKRSLIGIGVLVAIVLIAYLVSDGSDQTVVSEGTAKMVSGGLLALYVLFFGAIAVAVYSEVSRLFK